MKLQLIRNATLRIDYAGKTVLVDPFLAAKHSLPSYTGTSKNPLVELPIAAAEIIGGADLLLVSHLHSDHFDSVAKEMLPKNLPLLCQPGDEGTIREAGFTDVTPLDRTMDVGGISVSPTPGSHGLGDVLKLMGSVIGFVLRAPGEPTVYLCGDTVLYPPVLETIAREKPDVIVSHSGGAMWGTDPIIMDAKETIALCEATAATVVAVHMEALDHCFTSRAALREAATARGIAEAKLLIPRDGETMELGLSN